jgi:hypothetical protein
MSLVGVFLGASLTGWSTSSASAYAGSVVLAQVAGALWYSPLLFADPWCRAAYPKFDTQDELWKYVQTNFNPTKCYSMALVSSTLAFLLLRGMIRLTGVNGTMDGAVLGFILASAGTLFGMMHSFFECRPFALHVINQGFHLLCFSMAGALMATFP